MGTLVGGSWTDDDDQHRNGAFIRTSNPKILSLDLNDPLALHHDPGRYVIIASLSCPWSHRVLAVHGVKNLRQLVPVQIAGGKRIEGYPVNRNEPWTLPGTGKEIVHLHELYTSHDPGFTGRVTVPVLWDCQEARIAANDSMVIAKVFDKAEVPSDRLDFTLLPKRLLDEIQALNGRIYSKLGNGVYRAGLALNQASYDEAINDVFGMLDELEVRLVDQRLLFGPTITLADLFLFATLVRFDSVYNTHFRCTRQRLIDYPVLWAYARDIFGWTGIADFVDFDEIRQGYFINDGLHNPFKIVSAQPLADWREVHDRETLGPICVTQRDGAVVEVAPNTMSIGRDRAS